MSFYLPIHAECSRETKIFCKHIPQEKKSMWIKGLKRKIHIPNQPPHPSKVKWLAPSFFKILEGQTKGIMVFLKVAYSQMVIAWMDTPKYGETLCDT